MAKKKEVEKSFTTNCGLHRFLKVTKKVTSYRPLLGIGRGIRTLDALVYLSRVIPQDEPSLQAIYSLIGFELNNGELTEDKVRLASKIIDYWVKEGVL